jgi:hypothetical protein
MCLCVCVFVCVCVRVCLCVCECLSLCMHISMRIKFQNLILCCIPRPCTAARVSLVNSCSGGGRGGGRGRGRRRGRESARRASGGPTRRGGVPPTSSGTANTCDSHKLKQ